MIDEFFSKMFSPRILTSIEIVLMGQDRYLFKGLILEEKKGKIKIREEGFETGNADELIKLIPENSPIVLTLSGKAILSRFWDKRGKESLESIFPVRSIEDYHVEHFDSDGFRWAALAHQQNTEKGVDQLEKQKKNVLEIFFEDLPIVMAYDLLEDKVLQSRIKEIKSGNASTNMDENYTIAGIPVKRKMLRAFCAGLYYLVEKNEEKFIAKEARVNFAYQKFNEKIPKLSLAVILALVIVNFGLLTYLQDKSTAIEDQLFLNSSKTKELEKIRREFQVTQSVVQQQDWSSGKKAAFYLDRLATNMNNQLAFRLVELNPQAGKDFEIAFLDKILRVGGVVNELSVLDQWVVQLKQNDWVSNVEIEEVKTDQDNNRLFSFLIKIRLS
jgi:hypothetical protein